MPLPLSCVQLPTKEQTNAVTEELRARSKLPDYVGKVLAALPEGMHPMTQFSTLVLALQVRPTPHHASCSAGSLVCAGHMLG